MERENKYEKPTDELHTVPSSYLVEVKPPPVPRPARPGEYFYMGGQIVDPTVIIRTPVMAPRPKTTSEYCMINKSKIRG
jgi:hypothetical protein